MKIITKNILPLVLLWLFVNPTVIQFFHHHVEETLYHSYACDTLHIKYEKCAVCNFHFPIFSDQLQVYAVQPIGVSYKDLACRYNAPSLTSTLQVSSVRGPPAKVIPIHFKIPHRIHTPFL